MRGSIEKSYTISMSREELVGLIADLEKAKWNGDDHVYLANLLEQAEEMV